MKPLTLLALGNRKAPMSTELFIQAESSLDEVFVELWARALCLAMHACCALRRASSGLAAL